jgi:hypothetical protein
MMPVPDESKSSAYALALSPLIPGGKRNYGIVLWLWGTYRSHTDFDLEVTGLLPSGTTRCPRAGQPIDSARADTYAPGGGRRMALGWFQGSKEASLPELIAAKKYHKAIEVLKARFGEGSRDPWMRLQLADVLVLAGRPRESVPILNALADEFAREGFAAKAIAVLKKLQKIDPTRKDVEKRLAALLQEKRVKPDAPPRAGFPTEAEDVEIGIEDLGFAPSSMSVSAPTGQETRAAAPTPFAPERGTLDLPDASPVSEDSFEEEFIVALQDVIDAGEKRGADPSAEEQELYAAFFGEARTSVTGALLGDFTPEELVAVIGGLELITFEPGDIVITEGEPGDSLFVLTTGVLKTFVRDPSGHNALVRVLDEGSFFGEISVLTGSPRTATVVASTRCELLELDRSALDSITSSHPRVRGVIEEARTARAGSAEETKVRKRA